MKNAVLSVSFVNLRAPRWLTAFLWGCDHANETKEPDETAEDHTSAHARLWAAEDEKRSAAVEVG